jgi:uncharacterized membrane protein
MEIRVWQAHEEWIVTANSEKIVDRYLADVKRELRGLPRHRKRTFMRELYERILTAREALVTESEIDVRRMLEGLGHPADVAATAHDFAARPLRHGALEDAALITLSPLLILLAFFMALPPLLLLWLVGAVMLAVSKVWTVGEKLIGLIPSAVSFVWAGIGFDVHIDDPGAGVAGIAIGVSLIAFFLVVQMTPAFVGVIYLTRRLRYRSGPPMSRPAANLKAKRA